MNSAASAKSSCAACVLRHKGLCDAVADQDDLGCSALEAAHARTRVFDSGDVIYAQGDPPAYVFNLVSGWVALHRDMADGRRQILRFLLPGALFGIAAGELPLRHGATSVTNASVCPIPSRNFAELRAQAPSLNERYIRLLQQENDHAAEYLTTMGQGNAKERIGRVLGELCALSAGERAIAAGSVFRIPLTQHHIAEATGLTSIHVNRVLRQLREDLILEFQYGAVTVINPARLGALSGVAADWGPPGRMVASPGALRISARGRPAQTPYALGLVAFRPASRPAKANAG
jgi:CRP-like cAMP-binding protein